MKKLISTLILFYSLQLCALAQDLTAEQIVAKHVELTVNKGYFDTVTTNKTIAKAALSARDTVTLTVFKVAGRSLFMEFAVKGNTITQIYNQGTAAYFTNDKKEKVTSKSELEDLKLQTYMLPEAMYKQLGYKLTLEGDSRQDGVEYNVVKLESPSGYERTHYYEKSSDLLRIIVNNDDIKFHITEYVPFKGGMYPGKMTVYFPEGGGSFALTVTEYSDNAPIDPAVFKF